MGNYYKPQLLYLGSGLKLTKHGNAYTAIITEAETMASRGQVKGTWEELGVEMTQMWFSCMNSSVLKMVMHM